MNVQNLIKFNISLVILLQIFYKISSTKSIEYPYFITLENGNIFIIQKTGIDIYDQSLKKLNQIFEFSGKEEINDEIFSKITIKYNKEYILSIINDKLFIFNNEGKILFESEKINNGQTIYSYSLSFIQATNNTCDFVIGYFDQNSYINIYLYKYEYENNRVLLLCKYKNKNYFYFANILKQESLFEFTDKQKLLSCEYIYANDGGFVEERNLLVCFFNLNSTVGIVVFNIIDKYYEKQFEIIQYVGLMKNTLFITTQNIDNSKEITSIKTEINDNRTLAIVWWNFKGNNQTRYFIYDLTKMLFLYKFNDMYSFSSEYLNSWKMPISCSNREYEERISVFHNKNQFAFSCTLEIENIQILLYNKTNLMNDSYIENVFCENNYELSKLNFNDNKNYLIYKCLKNCSDKKFENDTDCLNERENEEEKENEEENKRENRREREEENKEKDRRENEEEIEEENERENEEEKEEEEEEKSTEKENENEEENKPDNIGKKGSDEEEKGGNIKNKRENEKMKIFIIILIIVIIIAILIVFIILIVKYLKKNNFWRKRNKDEKLMKDILSGLIPN